MDIIQDEWDDICEKADLTEVGCNLFGERMFLNGFAFENASKPLQLALSPRGRNLQPAASTPRLTHRRG